MALHQGSLYTIRWWGWGGGEEKQRTKGVGQAPPKYNGKYGNLIHTASSLEGWKAAQDGSQWKNREVLPKI